MLKFTNLRLKFIIFHRGDIREEFVGACHPLPLFFFFFKCKNIIDQKGAGDQQYKEKVTEALDQIKSKTSLLWQKKQTPLKRP